MREENKKFYALIVFFINHEKQTFFRGITAFQRLQDESNISTLFWGLDWDLIKENNTMTDNFLRCED